MNEILIIDPSEKFCTELSDALMKLGHVALYSRTLQEVRMLRGILHSCGYCGRIETSEGEWKPAEQFLVEYSEAMLSHGVCPECANKHWGSLSKVVIRGKSRSYR